MNKVIQFDAKLDPLVQIGSWLTEAAQTEQINPNAVALATTDSDGMPSVRYVLIKQVTASSLIFFTNRESEKGAQLLANSQAAIAAYWRSLARQLRCKGKISELSREQVAEYFASRPRGSQLGAAVSLQSRPLANSEQLVEQFAQLEQQLAGKDVPLPDSWSGFALEAISVEFWQEGEFRLHQRDRFTRKGDGWEHQLLYP